MVFRLVAKPGVSSVQPNEIMVETGLWENLDVCTSSSGHFETLLLFPLFMDTLEDV